MSWISAEMGRAEAESSLMSLSAFEHISTSIVDSKGLRLRIDFFQVHTEITYSDKIYLLFKYL